MPSSAIQTQVEIRECDDRPNSLPDRLVAGEAWDGNLIDLLLDQQSDLTAVERFSQAHSRQETPLQARYYRDLLPATPLQPGQQWAFEVDLDRCSGCKACVSACHSLNGLEEGESWREVGLLLHPVSDDGRGGTVSGSCVDTADLQIQHVTTACHHCVDPGCLNGCPVLAYEKDPITGIVHHLDDQCMGCRYCVMKCPYDVPKYSKRLGIVRKCDMCRHRLADAEAPACVQACPNQAIRIRIVDRESLTVRYREGLGSDRILPWQLPDSPDPALTLPATLFASDKLKGSTLVGADHSLIKPAESHLPLVWMLVLTQMSVGTLTFTGLHPDLKLGKSGILLSLATCIAGLVTATFHLGRPERAWKSFLGWRKSWFSREVMAFGLYVKALTLLAVSIWVPLNPTAYLCILLFSVLAGWFAVFCSAMIYIDTRRPYWAASRTFPRFIFTALGLGLVSPMILTIAHGVGVGAWAFWPAIAVLIYAPFLRWNLGFVAGSRNPFGDIKGSRWILARFFRFHTRARLVLLILSGIVVPVCLGLGYFDSMRLPLALLSLVGFLISECLERHLFFKAVVPLKMPGGIS